MDNEFKNIKVVAVPQNNQQQLILLNKGVNNTWNDYGIDNGPIDYFFIDSKQFAWIACGSTIRIYSSYSYPSPLIITTTIINLSGTSSATTKVNCIYESGEYMFIGGDFSSVVININSQPGTVQQCYGLTRIKLNYLTGAYSCVLDPLIDTTQNLIGVNGYVNTITSANDELYVGGLFSSFSTTSSTNSYPANNFFKIQNQSSTSGNQIYTHLSNVLGVNGEVFCSLVFNSSIIFIGGNYTSTDISNTSTNPNYSYFASWNSNSNSWISCDSNNFNAPVFSCAISIFNSNFILCGGGFTQNASNPFICYINTANTNAYVPTTLVCSSPIKVNGISARNGAETILLYEGATTNTTVYHSTIIYNWTFIGVSHTAYIPNGVFFYNSKIATSYKNYNLTKHYSMIPSSQSCEFTSQFIYKNETGTKYTLQYKYTSQIFVSITGIVGLDGGYWMPVGNHIGSLGN